MKIRGIKIEQGIKIKAVGLTKEEMGIIWDAMRRINHGRKKDKRPSLPYCVKLKQI